MASVIMHRLPAKEAAIRQAHHEMMKRRLLSMVEAKRRANPQRPQSNK